MKCLNCSTNNPAGAKFCNECGKPLDAPFSHATLPDPLNSDSNTSTVILPRIESLRQARGAVVAQDTNGFVDENLFSLGDSHVVADAFASNTTSESEAMAQPVLLEAPSLEKNQWNTNATMEMPAVANGFGAEPTSDFFCAPKADEAASNKRHHRLSLIILLVVILLGASVAGATYYFELWGGIRVPDVVGLNETQARTVLQEKGFSVRSMQVKSDDTEGKVILTDPGSSDRARKGGEVVIHVATPRTIPDVVGKTEDEAKKLMKESGYINVTFSKEKSNEEEGTVLSVSPEAGAKMKGATPVTITVAEPYTVPDVVGMDEQAAIDAVQSAGYLAQVLYEYSETQPEGKVLSTSPEAKTKLPSESAVIIKVSRSRANELLQILQGVLYPGASVQIGGTTYAVHSLDALTYAGNDVVKFVITGQAFTLLDGETVYGSTKAINGTATFDASNNYALT